MPTGIEEPSKKSEDRQEGKSDVKWWRRPVTWLAGLLGVLLAAIATAFGTGVGNSLFSAASGHSSSAGAHGATTGPPIMVNVYHELLTDNVNEAIVFPEKLDLTKSDLRAINADGGTGIVSWIAKRGGYEDVTDLKLTVTGRRPCRILDIRAIVLSRRAPVKGTLFEVPPGGTGGSNSIVFEFNLDSSSPVALTLPKYPGVPNPIGYFQTRTFTLEKGEQHTFQIYATTSDLAVSWVIDITILDGNKIIHDVIRNYDRTPFRTSAAAPFGGSPLIGKIRQYARSFYGEIYTQCYGLSPAHGSGLGNGECRGKPSLLWVKAK